MPLIPSHTKLIVLVCAVLLAGVSSSRAGLLAWDTFSYGDGSLTGNGGAGFSNSWSGGSSSGGTGTWSVNSGAASVTGTRDTWRSRTFESSITESFYFSVDLSAVAASAIEGSNTDVLLFRSGTDIVFGVGVSYHADNGIRAYLRINNGDYNNPLPASDSINTIVGRVTFNENNTWTVSLWLNPESEASSTYRSMTTATTYSSITGLTLQRYDSGSRGANTTTTFDNIVVGTDWTSVTTAIPESGSFAVLAGVWVFGSSLVIRRRR